jgi:hypothetical protein
MTTTDGGGSRTAKDVSLDGCSSCYIVSLARPELVCILRGFLFSTIGVPWQGAMAMVVFSLALVMVLSRGGFP